jgi:hypothetical protein
MVGHLAKADPACAEGVKKRHHARHDGAAMPGDERRAAGTNLGLVVVAMPLTGVTGSVLARLSWVKGPNTS